MNQQAREAFLAMIRQGDLTQQQAVAINAAVLWMLDATVSTSSPIRADFMVAFGTYGMEGLDSLR